MVNSLGQRNIDEEEMVFITVRVGTYLSPF